LILNESNDNSPASESPNIMRQDALAHARAVAPGSDDNTLRICTHVTVPQAAALRFPPAISIAIGGQMNSDDPHRPHVARADRRLGRDARRHQQAAREDRDLKSESEAPATSASLYFDSQKERPTLPSMEPSSA
jgi:hypothetical protein